jgi:hypothetical protein
VSNEPRKKTAGVSPSHAGPILADEGQDAQDGEYHLRRGGCQLISDVVEATIREHPRCVGRCDADVTEARPKVRATSVGH